MELAFAIFAENCNFVEIKTVCPGDSSENLFSALLIFPLHKLLLCLSMLLTSYFFFLSLLCENQNQKVVTAKPMEKSPTELRMEEQGLVDITTVVPGIHVSLMYARSDNFVGRVMYRDLRRAYLLPETAEALKKAQTALQKAHPELSLKVYDATRPMSVQQ